MSYKMNGLDTFDVGYAAAEVKYKSLLTAEREAMEKAEARATEYDRWLTGGVYFTNDEYVKHCEEFNAYKQRAESAEQRNREAMEQEPVAWIYPSDLEKMQSTETFCQVFSVQVGCPSEPTSLPLYAAPIPPADVAELQSKLAKSEDYIRKMNDEYWNSGAIDKLLEEAKRQTVPEGCIVERDFRYDVFTELHTPTITIFFPAGKGNDNSTWKMRDDFASMLSAAPQPDAAIRAKGN